MFSSRLPTSLAPNPLTSALRARRAAGQSVVDLTQSNPTQASFDYPQDLLRSLAETRGLMYEPTPLGLFEARCAVASDYARRGITLDPAQIALTASTSEAYSLLFKILCEPGDAVLVPRPSYPLFDHLAALDNVVPIPYDLEYDGRWSIDVDSVLGAWTPRTRALLCVHPNNPTGSFVTPGEFAHLADCCRDRDAPLVIDEVFADYAFDSAADAGRARVLERDDVIVFSLGGLSKTVGLPQAKLAWMGVSGPSARIPDVMSRLEFACDTYLSVSTPVQIAAADLLLRGAGVRHQIQSRVMKNRRHLADADLHAHGCTLLDADAGWSAILKVPSIESEDACVLRLLTERGILVHPGYFFDFPREAYLVLSLLVPEPVFAAGVAGVLAHFAVNLEHGRRR